MALAMTASASGIMRDPNRYAKKAPEAWMEPEMGFDDHPRFLVSLFLRDRPGLLATVLGVLDDGLPFQSPTGKVKFSIDGSLSSSVIGAFALAFVVRPVFTQAAMETETPFEVIIPELLKGELYERLVSIGECDVESIEVTPFQGLTDRLFHQRRFSEYRFGLASRTKSAEQLKAFASITARFTKRLGQHRIPIAYLYFPRRMRATATLPLGCASE